jgi:hypothetical protein
MKSEQRLKQLESARGEGATVKDIIIKMSGLKDGLDGFLFILSGEHRGQHGFTLKGGTPFVRKIKDREITDKEPTFPKASNEQARFLKKVYIRPHEIKEMKTPSKTNLKPGDNPRPEPENVIYGTLESSGRV